MAYRWWFGMGFARGGPRGFGAARVALGRPRQRSKRRATRRAPVALVRKKAGGESVYILQYERVSGTVFARGPRLGCLASGACPCGGRHPWRGCRGVARLAGAAIAIESQSQRGVARLGQLRLSLSLIEGWGEGGAPDF